MCGIAGIVGGVDEADLRIMTQMLAHRGPDDGGIWMADDRVAGLGHRRLSIIDLSRAARQPMMAQDGGAMITYNGEIFNFGELRTQLEAAGRCFRTRSDTEVLLAAWQEWGMGVLGRLRGQFAFAVWNMAERTLILARDHLGIKPLYWHARGGRLHFASEAKAIVAVCPDTRQVNWERVPTHLTWLWTPGPETLFHGVRKLAPGSWLRWHDGEVATGEYWDPVEAMPDAGAIDGSPTELRRRLATAVEEQLVSDVPLGLLLSGGLDSTAILRVMSGRGRPVRAFTARYGTATRGHDVFEDDARYAGVAAVAYGATLEMRDLDDRVAELLPRVLWHLDEPLADPTVVTNLQLTAAAKATNTVLLSGMGADEILAGYPRHPAVLLGGALSRVPGPLFRAVNGLLRLTTRAGLTPIARTRRAMLLARNLPLPFRERFIGFSSYWTRGELRDVFTDDAVTTAAIDAIHDTQERLFERYARRSPLTQMLAVDLRTFLPCLNLENMDKTSMANAVEIRVPFLDHRFVEYCLALPDEGKLRGHTRKAILREAFSDLPADILRRPKTGYSPPVRGWVRTTLAEAISDTLLSAAAQQRGLWRRGTVERLLRENARGVQDHSLRLWTMYTFELWLSVFFGGALQPPALPVDDPGLRIMTDASHSSPSCNQPPPVA